MKIPVKMNSLLVLNSCLFLSLFPCVASSSVLKIPAFSTKTPYFWMKNIDEDVTEDAETWVHFENKECQIVHLNLILRHGSRFPTLTWTRKMAELERTLKKNSESLNKNPFLKSWDNPFSEKQAGQLADVGEEEHFILGKRFGNRFNLLFDGDLETVFYGVTYKQRTHDSFKSFYEGLTEALGEDSKNIKPSVNDEHLRFFDKCTKYIETVENNIAAAPEHQSFKHGQQMQQVANKMADRLGLKTLSTDEAMTIHHLCTFELAMFDESDWCDILDKEDLLVFEYLYDLKQFWRRSYGHPINWGMTCPFISNLFKQLDNIIKKTENGEEYSVANIQFAHAETIIPLFTAFGLFNDSIPLKADEFDSRSDRLFKTSKIVPMSANIGVGLYQCEASEDTEDEIYVIRMFVNEEPIVIPACGKKICKYTDFVKYYEHFVNCDYSEICKNKKQHDEL